MAQITITIPDAVLSRVLDAFAAAFSYNPATDGTKAQFAKAQVIKFIKNTVKGSESFTPVNTARANVEASVETDISLS